MAVRKNRKLLIINIFAVALVLAVTAFLAFYFIDTDPTVASSDGVIQIKIEKAATISVYAFGEGVEFVESTNSYDLYTAEAGTSVRLQAVNETRIFTGWVITKNANSTKTKVPSSSTNQIITFDVDGETADLDVSVTRVNATANNYGQYMLDRFVIVDEADLIALQNILDGSTEDSDFAKFYDNLEGLNKEDARTTLQNGYFLIANNFTVFNSNFKGIGSAEYPFNGVMCGKNNGEVSKLFITITDKEKAGTSSYGLFKYLGEKAVIRNLKVSTSIGIEETGKINEDNIIYAGGLSGVMSGSTLIDVEVSTSIGIESNNASEIYAGGLFGSIEAGSGIDSISDVVYDGSKSHWSIVSHKEDSVISAGFIAGKATDSYIKEADIIVTNQEVELKNDSVTNSFTDSKLYLGNVFGSYYAVNDEETIDDIMIMGDKGESLRSITANGTAIVGGLIGYVEANSQNGSLNIDKVYFRVLGSKNEYEASTIKTSDVADVYVGGIAGFVEGTKVFGLDGFKDRFQNVKIDNTTVRTANYLFEGDYELKAIQNGTSIRQIDNTPLGGKAVASGIVGRGYIDISSDGVLKRSELALVSPTSSLLVQAEQSKLTTTPIDKVDGKDVYINDKDHAVAALIYGVLGASVDIYNINVYTNNTTIQTLREPGSTAMGDLHTGGFIGYATGIDFTDISLYFNNSKILAESLSYAITTGNPNGDTNSAYCGGFAGEVLGNSTLTNITFAGYDTNTLNVTGTTSSLESIQNTMPGGGDYKGENYIGGIVGRIQYATLENCNFKGSTGTKDYIKMTGHQSPDSAFCGGIVGLIRTATTTAPASITNCNVTDTEISGNATNTNTGYNNPDIYIGGIVGAAYLHATTSKVTITDCTLTNSEVYAVGNELIAAYAGGIIGGATWESSMTISDCYVTDSSIKSNTSTTIWVDRTSNPLESSAAGIVALKGADTTVEVSHCVVIDTEVDAKVNSDHTFIRAYASGIAGFTEVQSDGEDIAVSLKNCYSNASVVANHKAANGVAKTYGLAYNGNNGITDSSEEKTVTGLLTTYTYHSFTYNNGYQSYIYDGDDNITNEGTYSFILVDNTGRYKIRRNSDNKYVRIIGYSIYYSNESNATNFTFDNGNFINNRRYLTISNGEISYSSTQNSEDVKTTLNSVVRTADLENGEISNKYFQSYYLNKNAENALDTFGTALGTGPYDIPQSTVQNPIYVNPYTSYDYINGFDGTRQKFYIELIEPTNNCPFVVTAVNANNVVTISSTGVGQTLAHIWINAKAEGSETIPDHHDKAAAASDGWFILDYVLLTTGDLADIECDLSNINTSYIDGETIDSNYIEHDYVENSYLKEFTFNLYDNMSAFNVDFDITHFGANYTLKITKVHVEEDAEGNKTEIEEEITLSYFRRLYGDIELSLQSKHSHDGLDKYNLYYKPNETLETDETIKIYFIGGTGLNTAKTAFKINLKANKFTLKGITYADYTPPLNYYEDVELGTQSNPYLLAVDTTTKFIPIFTKSNDLVKTDYVLEKYIEKCEYDITSNSEYFSVNPSGEVKTSKTLPDESLSVGQLTISYTVGGETQTQTIYIKIVNKIKINYSIEGSEIDGLTIATNATSFHFGQSIRNHYLSIPTTAVITIDGTEYDILNNYAECLAAGITVTPISEISLFSNSPFVGNATGYEIEVSNNLLKTASAIDVDITYPNVYTITFELQCKDFNSDYNEGVLSKSYEVTSGTTYKQFYAQYGDEINAWAEGAKIDGYVFTGFFLVREANSSGAYGISFENISNADYPINSSNTFYGRWSYLIDILEAPGTHIKTGFNSSFMMNYEYERNENLIETQIPINNKQGYVFRIETDDWYQGTPTVEAFVKTALDRKKIPIIPYPENENLYYINPEDITGYLVVITSSTNSEVIVGENTSSVTEAIAPEDGIITFKYIANHYYNEATGEKTYIYNVDGYSSLTKEFVLDFYKVSDASDFKLPDLTEIKVHYHLYINGVLSESIVGTYITYDDDRIYLSEFKLLDLENKAFPTKTYGNILHNGSGKPYEKVTEVYYFTLTPPNGYSKNVVSEIANYKVELGYCRSNSSVVDYLEGSMTENPLPNSQMKFVDESKQEKTFQIVPTRNTTIVEDEGTYTFTDDKTYSIYNITLTNTEKQSNFNYISLYDEIDRNSTLTSSIMSFNIKELALTLGYRLGNVDIYGQKVKDGDWTLVETINVDSAVYKEYKVDFKDGNGDYPYYAYKIDNTSTNEIRVYNIDVTSGTNGIVYKGPISNFVETSTKNTYALTNYIVGDARHDGKTFMLAIQLESKTAPNDIITDLPDCVSINVNTTEHRVYLSEYQGKNTAYINLSNILAILNVNSIDFTINITNNNYQIHTVQLLEVANEFKPSLGEVRREFTKVTFVEPDTDSTDNTLENVIKIATYNNSGEVSGSDASTAIPINYFCDTSIQPVKLPTPKGNNLVYQCKILLQRQADTDYYKVLAVDNDGTSADMTSTYTNHKYSYGNLTWTHAIATAYTDLDYKNTYTKYIDWYLYIPNTLTLEEDTDAVFQRCSNELKNNNGELQTYTLGTFVEEMPNATGYEKVIKIAGYNNGGLASGGGEIYYPSSNTKVAEPTLPINYLCSTNVLTYNNLRYQNKILLKQVDGTKYYQIVAICDITDDISATDLATQQGVTWTHAIASAYDFKTNGYPTYKEMYGQYVSKNKPYYVYIEDYAFEADYVIYPRVETELNQKYNDSSTKPTIPDINLRTYFTANIVQNIISTTPPSNQPTSTIYYDLNGGEWINTPTGEDYGDLYVTTPYKGETITLPIPKRDGYTFAGWYYVGESVGTSIVAKDCLLVARWEVERIYAINYELNGGNWTYSSLSAMANDFIKDFNSITGKNVTSASELYTTATNNYDMLYSNDAMREKWLWVIEYFIDIIDKKYYPNTSDSTQLKYARNEFQVFIDKNFSKKSEYLSQYTVGDSHPILRQFMVAFFTGSKAPSGSYFYTSINWNFSAAPLANTQWTFYSLLEQTTFENQIGTVTLRTPYRPGYTFAGWYLNADFSGNPITTVTRTTTVYAKWIAK